MLVLANADGLVVSDVGREVGSLVGVVWSPAQATVRARRDTAAIRLLIGCLAMRCGLGWLYRHEFDITVWVSDGTDRFAWRSD